MLFLNCHHYKVLLKQLRTNIQALFILHLPVNEIAGENHTGDSLSPAFLGNRHCL